MENKRKVGRLYWNNETSRAFVRFEDGSPEIEVHPGQVMDTITCCAWARTKLEKDATGHWYLTNVYAPGELAPGIPVLLSIP